ncbi:MAG TPA: hypothetical protein VKA44_05755 [Gemmatimonadota bacterium]|nr:hypothetical protein [Gemmatimonadota bacterium]
MRWARSCLARVGCLTLLVLGAGAAWMGRDTIAAWWQSRSVAAAPETASPSPDLADRAARKLEDFMHGRGPDRVEFDGPELQSLVLYRLADSLPAGLTDPRVSLGDSTIEASGALQVERLMDGKAPDAMRSLLGDSARASAEVVPEMAGPGILLLDLRHVTAGGLPIPSMMVPWLLDQVGVPHAADRPGAVAVRVPAGLADVSVDRGRLRLERRPGG